MTTTPLEPSDSSEAALEGRLGSFTEDDEAAARARTPALRDAATGEEVPL